MTVELQRANISFIEVRALFDGLSEEYPSMKNYLAASASIVHSKDFESGLLKIFHNRESTLTAKEKEACKQLLKEGAGEVEETSFVKKLFADNLAKSKYIDCTFIPPGSVIVESLFSAVGWMFDDRRLATTPVHIEEQVFLKVFRVVLLRVVIISSGSFLPLR